MATSSSRRQGVLLDTEADTTATRTSEEHRNLEQSSGLLIEVTTANKVGTTATYTPKLIAVFPSGEEFTLWTAAAALTANGTAAYQLGPATGGSATESDFIAIPVTWKLELTVASASGSHNMDTSASFSYTD